MIQDFASSISNYYEVQKQYLLQVVEHQRKAIPNFFKDTLKWKISTLKILFFLIQWVLTPEILLATPLALYLVYKCIVHQMIIQEKNTNTTLIKVSILSLMAKCMF